MSFRGGGGGGGGRRDCVCYVGDLPSDVHERELEDIFYKVRSSPIPPAHRL
jgi:hypothetical protein